MDKKILIDELLALGVEVSDPNNDEHTTRKHDDPFIVQKKDTDSRDPFERDYARVLHSPSFRRLQGKMQLLGTQTNDYYRTRLTHSLEVSQIGAEIATKVYADNDSKIKVSKALVTMACLTHDIGNPPFGHFGEKALNMLMKDHGGFEGNAQTLRIVCNLEQKSQDYKGLNLTLASRLALVKYNVTAQQKNKEGKLKEGKFLYDDLTSEINTKSKLKTQTLECQIMEISDDIAYACHDLEDSLKSGVLTLEDVIWSLKSKDKSAHSQFTEILEISKKLCGNSHGDIYLKSITSVLINTFVNDIKVIDLNKEEMLKKGTVYSKGLGLKEYKGLLKQLKNVVYDLLVRQPSVAEYEIKGGIIVRQLFTMLVDEKYNYNNRLFPLEYQKIIENNPEVPTVSLYRTASDYISEMTDSFAMRLYKKHFGKDMPSYNDCDWNDSIN
ncbi:deoxyguanosinetriphosphate triphosphohydrolase family protein [Paenibacillus sp. NPDC058174]|uniref:deoxyguanosinetriphosphate triphosphohydrolase family protein n=1 Tax=Paenibacillus sp. NPDC058174 TaxID=3346366 RepID=UPI0036DDE878